MNEFWLCILCYTYVYHPMSTPLLLQSCIKVTLLEANFIVITYQFDAWVLPFSDILEIYYPFKNSMTLLYWIYYKNSLQNKINTTIALMKWWYFCKLFYNCIACTWFHVCYHTSGWIDIFICSYSLIKLACAFLILFM